jgi:hypothetical protein
MTSLVAQESVIVFITRFGLKYRTIEAFQENGKKEREIEEGMSKSLP